MSSSQLLQLSPCSLLCQLGAYPSCTLRYSSFDARALMTVTMESVGVGGATGTLLVGLGFRYCAAVDIVDQSDEFLSML